VSAIRALIKRKRALLSDFFRTGFCRSSLDALCQPTRACVFVSLNRNTDRALARRGDPFSQPSGSSAG
jgi:hypothetical protein